MSCMQVVQQFEALRQTNDFVQYEKDFADSLVSSLVKWSAAGEVPTVKALDDMINNQKLKKNGLTLGSTRYDLETNSVFIHGKKSLVQFNYPGNIKDPVELGDLLLICTLVYGGKRYFERMTIVQFKMENARQNIFSWTVDNDKQLYLLSRFPTFTSVEGILSKGINYNLRNTSDCLGSYGLLQTNGDFVFISGITLDGILGKRNTIRKNEMHSQRNSICYNGLLFDNCLLCLNTHIFAVDYLGLNIGEFTVSCGSLSNLQARNFLGRILASLEYRIKRGRGTPNISQLLSSFSRFPYSDGLFGGENFQSDQDFTDDNGIGIIHTTINVGESDDLLR